MNPFNSIWRRLRSLGQRRAVKQEVDEELRFHIEQRTAQSIAAGISPEKTAREARKRFGNLQSVREECRKRPEPVSARRWGRIFASVCGCCARIPASPPSPC